MSKEIIETNNSEQFFKVMADMKAKGVYAGAMENNGAKGNAKQHNGWWKITFYQLPTNQPKQPELL